MCCRSLHSQQADGGTGTEPTEQVTTYQQPGLDYSLQRRDPTTPVYPHMISSTQHIQSEYVSAGTAPQRLHTAESKQSYVERWVLTVGGLEPEVHPAFHCTTFGSELF